MDNQMWNNLPNNQKNKYKTLITNFASLTEAFTQKSFGDKHVKPFINSKFQETAFQYAFNATEEDIANTSFDASIATDSGNKYLVGIKSFLYSSGDQKVAQFKSDSSKWAEMFSQIKKNAEEVKKNKGKKRDLDKKNHDIYLKLAKDVSELRNERIRSSRAQLKGFKDTGNVVSVYHVLMPSESKDKTPLIHVGETSYTEINIDKIRVLGCTGLKTPNNFRFTDGIHTYKYASADSQLFMTFNNRDIVVDTWKVNYISDAMKFFETLRMPAEPDDTAIPYSAINLDNVTSFSWMLIDKYGEVNSRSGFNEFNAQSKKPKADRKKSIINFENKYKCELTQKEMGYLDLRLNNILLPKKSTKDAKKAQDKQKQELRIFADKHNYLKADLINLIYDRPHNEVYIPLPNSMVFHKDHPDFFKKGLGINLLGEKGKIIKDQKDRTFMLRFMPSKNKIEGYIDQQNGKAIQSPHSQSILGKWLRENVFQLKDLELLTANKLDNLGINAIRLVKNTTLNTIDVYFIWIDPENPPQDAIGWVAKDKK